MAILTTRCVRSWQGFILTSARGASTSRFRQARDASLQGWRSGRMHSNIFARSCQRGDQSSEPDLPALAQSLQRARDLRLPCRSVGPGISKAVGCTWAWASLWAVAPRPDSQWAPRLPVRREASFAGCMLVPRPDLAFCCLVSAPLNSQIGFPINARWANLCRQAGHRFLSLTERAGRYLLPGLVWHVFFCG